MSPPATCQSKYLNPTFTDKSDLRYQIKNTDENFKIKIVETLWNIIYSDGNSDMYESNFMRRLTGLLYLDNKIVGDIKEKTKNKLNK